MFDAAARPALEDVGVLNYDAYDMVGGPRTRAAVRQLATIVRSGLDRFGAIALFWNADLDAVARRGHTPASELRRHADELAELLAELVGQRRVITGPMLLPPGAELDLGDGATGLVGAFEVYRGRPGGHRMANPRLILR